MTIFVSVDVDFPKLINKCLCTNQPARFFDSEFENGKLMNETQVVVKLRRQVYFVMCSSMGHD